MSAGLAVGQLQLALAHNVRYLDGGWETLVDGLRAPRPRSTAVAYATGAAVVELVRGADGALAGVRLRSGEVVRAAAVILALDAAAAAPLLPEGAAALAAARDADPVRAACLDVGLARLPRPRATFALGIDEPLYCSVHSAAAPSSRPRAAAMIHVARYLGDDTPDPGVDERELEGVLDRLQPGWRDVVVERRFLPHMVVASALATAAGGGLRSRPGAGRVAEVPASTSPATGSAPRDGSPTPAWRARGTRPARARAGAPHGQRGPRRRDVGLRTTRRRRRASRRTRGFLWELCYRHDRGRRRRGRSGAGDVRARPGASAGATSTPPWRPWLVRVAREPRRATSSAGAGGAWLRGPWLPSPIETPDEEAPPPVSPSRPSTEGRYDLLESCSFAFLLALEALTPQQRAVLLLRDVFDYSVPRPPPRSTCARRT